MGTFIRQYWIPSGVPSALLPTPDCPPIRVRLLGEDLIAFRTTSGQVGIVTNACPHRGASMFFGRNEEEGLRCVYHGWKFDVTGACVDMPSEPPESNFRSKVRTRAYPCREVHNMVWTYMGPRETPPALPALEFNTAPDEQVTYPEFHFYDCNWMQALEGDIDSSHVDYLHARITPDRVAYEIAGGEGSWHRDRTPDLWAVPMEYGAVYAAQRQWDDQENQYYRIAQFLFPFYTMIPGAGSLSVWLPLDDDHTLMIWLRTDLRGVVAPERRVLQDPYRRIGGYLPATSDPLTRWRPPAHAGNDYMRDFEIEKTRMFTGIPRDPKTQDLAMTESMGSINDRTKEHLGRSDAMIIAVRRQLLAAAKAMRDEGTVHATVDSPSLYRVRSGSVILPKGVDWFEATAEQRRSDSGAAPMQIVAEV
jgi:nitrite reductase/ring-hydroxylating ferredoxin subunit